MVTLPQIDRVGQQFSPRDQNGPAEEIIDNFDGKFSVEKQDANRLPCGSEMNKQIFTFRSKNFANLLGTSVVRQFHDAA